MSTEQTLRTTLRLAQVRVGKATAALAPKHKGGEMEEYRLAYRELLTAERNLASHLGHQFAVTLENYTHQWDIGAPCPHVVSNDHTTYVAYYAQEAAIRTTAHDPIVVVQFHRCLSAKLGSPNDEVFRGHPLHGSGLEPYAAQRVVNSRWLAEIQQTNGVHRSYDPETWKELTHYVFWFHDSTFECIALRLSVEVHADSMPNVLHMICDRLASGGAA